MGVSGAVFELLGRAQRRQLWQLIATHAVELASFLLAGVALLLLVGTNLLPGSVLAVAALICLALLVLRVRRNQSSSYHLAQLLDSRLHLHDALSTAVYYTQAPTAYDPLAIRDLQRQQAEQVSRSVDLPTALPWQTPLSAYFSAALLLLVGGLFVLRFARENTLDLRSPLVSYESLPFLGAPLQTKAERRQQAKLDQTAISELGASDAQEPDPLQNVPGISMQQSQPGTGEAVGDNTQQGSSSGNKQAAATGDPSRGDQGSEQSEAGESGSEQEGAQNSPAGSQQSGSQQGKQGAEQQAKNGNPQSENSLLSKMRDALSNMMQKMSAPQSQQQGQQNSGSPSQQKGSQQQAKGQQQGQQSNAQGQQGSQEGSAEQQGDQQGAPGDKADGKPGKEGQQGDGSRSQEAKSGMGKQDGNKDVREAEQLAAMGKISEIIGKRAQTVSGEMMIESPSSRQQQLTTQYSQQRALHREAGSDSERSEIPLAYQQYVQQYFTSVHKVGAAKAGNGKAATGAAQ